MAGRLFSETMSEMLRDPEFAAEYEALEQEFATAKAMIAARAKAGLTQAQLASRMGTTQSVVARWESGKSLPSTRTLQSFAKATDTKLCITFC